MKKYIIKRTIQNDTKEPSIYYQGLGMTFASEKDPYIKEYGYNSLKLANKAVAKLKQIYYNDNKQTFEIMEVNV